MKLKRYALSLFMTSTLAVFGSAAEGDIVMDGDRPSFPTYCDYVLSTYLQAYTTTGDFSEIQEDVEAAENLALGTSVPLTSSHGFEPLFKRELFYQFLAEELHFRGFSTIEQMQGALLILTRPENFKDLLALTNNTWRRTLAHFKNVKPGSDNATIKNLTRESIALNIPLAELVNLLAALDSQIETNFHTPKLAYLHELMTSKEKLADKLTPQKRLARVFAKPAPNNEGLYELGKDSIQVKRIVKTKTRFLLLKAAHPDSSFDLLASTAIKEINDSYFYHLSTDFRENEILSLLEVASAITSDEKFEKSFMILQKMTQWDVPPKASLVEKLVELRDSGSTQTVERRKLYETFLDLLKRLLFEDTAKLTDELSSSRKEYDVVFLKAFDSFKVNAHQLGESDFSATISRLVSLLSPILNEDLFRKSVHELVVLALSRDKENRDLFLEPLLALEKVYRYSPSTHNEARANWLRQIYLSGKPMPEPIRAKFQSGGRGSAQFRRGGGGPS